MATKAKLASDRSARWAFMERFEVPNYDSDGNYLTRTRIVQTPWFGVYLHRFDGPDPRDTLHDHPWPFLSFVLRGGYVERRLNPHDMTVNEHHIVRRVNHLGLQDAHAITRLLRVPTWTLMFVGRRVRTWGYLEAGTLTHDPNGTWIDGLDFTVSPKTWRWTEFNKHRHAAEFDAAMARRRERKADQ